MFFEKMTFLLTPILLFSLFSMPICSFANEFEDKVIFSLEENKLYKTQEIAPSVEKACMEFLLYFLQKIDVETPVKSYEEFLSKAESAKTASTVVGGYNPKGEGLWNFIKYGKPINITFIALGEAKNYILRDSYLEDGSYEACSFSYIEDSGQIEKKVYEFNISSFQYDFSVIYRQINFKDSEKNDHPTHSIYIIPTGSRAERIRNRISGKDETATKINEMKSKILFFTSLLISILLTLIIFLILKTAIKDEKIQKEKIILFLILILLLIFLIYGHYYISRSIYLYT